MYAFLERKTAADLKKVLTWRLLVQANAQLQTCD
jgi:hypothetical protein